MKATTLLSSILGAVSAVTFSALPSFAIPTTVPITGGTFNVIVNQNKTPTLVSFNAGTALTPLGPIVFSSISNIAIDFPFGLTDDQPIAFAAMSSTGTISGQSFTNAPLNLTGIISTAFLIFPSTTLVNTTVTSGTISLSTKLVASLTPTPTSLIPPNNISKLVADAKSARGILDIQSVPDVEQQEFLPPSGLAGSRIHPDLFAK